MPLHALPETSWHLFFRRRRQTSCSAIGGSIRTFEDTGDTGKPVHGFIANESTLGLGGQAAAGADPWSLLSLVSIGQTERAILLLDV